MGLFFRCCIYAFWSRFSEEKKKITSKLSKISGKLYIEYKKVQKISAARPKRTKTLSKTLVFEKFWAMCRYGKNRQGYSKKNAQPTRAASRLQNTPGRH